MYVPRIYEFNDQVVFFATVFDVTHRTFNANDSGYVENAFLVGTVEGDRVNGLRDSNKTHSRDSNI